MHFLLKIFSQIIVYHHRESAKTILKAATNMQFMHEI